MIQIMIILLLLLFLIFVFLPSVQSQDTKDNFYHIDDMNLSKQQYDVLFGDNISRRNGVIEIERTWPNKIIPYIIHNHFDRKNKSLIEKAFNIIANISCIKFEELVEPFIDNDYVLIKPGEGCSSSIGYRPGQNIIYLNETKCMELGKIQHEFLHILGFLHMHTSSERDRYVKILWNNIQNTSYQNFYATKFTSLYGTEYDFESITHYSTRAFSHDGKPTIASKIPGKDSRMGQREHLSAGDIIRINRMYDCFDEKKKYF